MWLGWFLRNLRFIKKNFKKVKISQHKIQYFKNQESSKISKKIMKYQKIKIDFIKLKGLMVGLTNRLLMPFEQK